VSLLDTKPEPLSPEMLYRIVDGCKVVDGVIHVHCSPGELSHAFLLALDRMADLAMRQYDGDSPAPEQEPS